MLSSFLLVPSLLTQRVLLTQTPSCSKGSALCLVHTCVSQAEVDLTQSQLSVIKRTPKTPNVRLWPRTASLLQQRQHLLAPTAYPHLTSSPAQLSDISNLGSSSQFSFFHSDLSYVQTFLISGESLLFLLTAQVKTVLGSSCHHSTLNTW